MSLVEKALRKLRDSEPRVAQQADLPRPHADVTVTATGSNSATSLGSAAPAPGRIVCVNTVALRAAGLVPPEHEERRIAQQYSHIKRRLIANASGRGAPRLPKGYLIMLASAVPGEGKTFTAINLALSMSREKDVRVLLADADVIKPHISRQLGVEDAPGLLDVLRDPRLDVESVILPTNVHNLSVLPAGRPSADATELLASARMEQVARALGQHDEQRVVLIDSPPLLHTTESPALAQVAGQVVFVVRAGATAQQVVVDALSHLREHPAVALVLNQSMMATHSGYYYNSDSRPGQSDK